MPTVEFEPAIPTHKRPQSYVLDRAATGTDISSSDITIILLLDILKISNTTLHYPVYFAFKKENHIACMKKVHILIFEHNQRDATLSCLFIYFCEMPYMFQAISPPIIRSSKLYIQHRVLCQIFTATCHCRGRDGTA